MDSANNTQSLQPHIYAIGIGGVGMAWIADYCLDQGWKLSGSDMVESAITKRLQEAGANIHYGSQPDQIPDDITEVVINSAITPSSPSYPELQEVEKRKLPIVKRAAWLGKLTRTHTTLAVAGTHGKTTTTAMLGWILDKAGLDPTVFVGGSVKAWGNKTRIGKSKYLVIEADEFDRSFHQFNADMAIVLNIDADHLDYYKEGLPEIEHSFRRFLRNLPINKGIVVGYGRNASLRKVAKGFSYKFRWYDEGHIWPGLKLQIPGKHNLLNATAAAKIAHEVGVDSSVIREALASFPGVGRRFEYLGHLHEAEVYDDYAHHPQEIRATLQAFREKFPTEHMTLVFQPHQKSRTKLLLEDFGRCFDSNHPDQLILAPIYEVAGREENIEVSSADIAELVQQQPNSIQIQAPLDLRELEAAVQKASSQKGILVSMGAGSIRSLMEGWM